MVVNVYFESNTHAELSAKFDDEDTYSRCADVLDAVAEEANMIVTTSVDEDETLTPQIWKVGLEMPYEGDWAVRHFANKNIAKEYLATLVKDNLEDLVSYNPFMYPLTIHQR